MSKSNTSPSRASSGSALLGKIRSMHDAVRSRMAVAMANVAAVEAVPLAPGLNLGSPQAGSICLANEALLVQAEFNEPLTNYAVGYRDPNNIDDALEFLAPAVQASRRFTYAEHTHIEEFLADPHEDLRAIGSDFPTVRYTAKKTPAVMDNRGLSYVIDIDELPKPTPPGWEQLYVARLLRRIKLNSYLRALMMLDAAAISTPLDWTPVAPGATATAYPNPDGDIRAQLKSGADSLGFRSNRVLYGDSAWDARVTALEAANAPLGYAGASRTPEMLAAYLGVEGVRVNRQRYSLAGQALAETVGMAVYSYFAEGGASTEDASNIKRFTSPTDAGGPYAVYTRQISSKLWVITVEHYEAIKITSPLGIRKAAITA